MKGLKIATGIIVGYVALSLLLGGVIAYLQPQREGTIVLRTFDDTGNKHETVLRLITDDSGQRWLWSGKWFRSWYKRALQNPEVELVQTGTEEKLRAVEVTDPATIERVVETQRREVSPLFWWFGKSTVLFAPIKILRLDSR